MEGVGEEVKSGRQRGCENLVRCGSGCECGVASSAVLSDYLQCATSNSRREYAFPLINMQLFPL